MAYETEVRVLGGLPVTIEYSINGAEPDVGIFQPWVDDWSIVCINDRAVKKCAWLDKRINDTPGEVDRIMEALNEDAAQRWNEPDYWED